MVTFAPVLKAAYTRISKSAPDDTPIRLSLFKHCICVFLSYTMLLSPIVLDTLANATNDYSNLDIATWGADNTTIDYTYDDNGSLTNKDTTDTGPDPDETKETVVYEYNLQNRLSKVTTTPYTAGVAGTPVVTIYTYNTQGIRTSKDVDGTLTTYLIDSYNHTGYAQVLEETTGSTRTTYTIGDDVIAQCATGGTTKYLLYDGHGSTRQLVDDMGAVISGEEYSYDGYGVMLGDAANPESGAGTKMLYAGEQYDENASMYYNRARYYNQSNGTFNRVDPYSGNMRDPQSLHKYAYVHNNPVNGIDPTGQFFSFAGMLSVASIIGTIFSIVAPAVVGIIGTNRIIRAIRNNQPYDAIVVSFSLSVIAPIFKAGFGGGLDFNYDLLYIYSLGRWQDYYAPGLTVGRTGGSLTAGIGPVWNVKEVGDYERSFFSASMGGTAFKSNLGPWAGAAGSVFWAPGQNGSFGMKLSMALTPNESFIYSGSYNYYFSGGPFSWCRSVVKWFDDNVVPPPMRNPGDVQRFFKQLTGTL